MKRIKNLLARLRLRSKGHFPYFGEKVFSPPNTILFQRVRDEGVFERVVIKRMQGFVKPGTWLFDVGANIGLMSVPILASKPSVQVLSIEPSPNSFPFLTKTRDSASFSSRWKVLSLAVSDSIGETEFVLADFSNSAFEGMRDTHRVATNQTIKVKTSSLDEIWKSLGHPNVSLVKIDVEGAESRVLQGASALIERCRPSIILEWCHANLNAFDVSLEWLLNFAHDRQFLVFDIDHLCPVTGIEHLRVLSQQNCENFLLVPCNQIHQDTGVQLSFMTGSPGIDHIP